jgi:cytochrome b561
MRDSFVNYAGFRYLRWSLVLGVASIIAYAWHEPVPQANGGTWLGYTLGTIGALLIFWLLWLGIRKRRYSSRMGTLKGWTSAHIYFGLILLLVATLHTGFQFGWNIHTLAYALMVLVIVSGFWGMLIYLKQPRLMTLNQEQQTRDSLFQTLQDLDTECLQMADGISTDLHRQLSETLKPVSPPGLRTRLSNRYWSATVAADTGRASRDPGEVEKLRGLLNNLSQRRKLSQQLGLDFRMQALMEFWLYLHVPISIALLGALVSHIIAVFFYW